MSHPDIEVAVPRKRGRPKGSGKKPQVVAPKVAAPTAKSDYAFFKPADVVKQVEGEVTYVDGVKYTKLPYLGPDMSAHNRRSCRNLGGTVQTGDALDIQDDVE